MSKKNQTYTEADNRAVASAEAAGAPPAALPASPPLAAAINRLAKPRFEIKVPSANFNGVRHGVHFSDGVARTDNQKAAMLLKLAGYEVKDHAPTFTAGTAKE